VPYSLEQQNYFENNKEVFYYHDTDELIEKAKYLLALPNEEALKIREAAYTRSTHSGYTFKDRSKQVFEIFKRIAKDQ
jgi:spore maturation protein CgeB